MNVRRGKPPSLDQRPWRYAAFFATYLYQGLIAGFSLTALANHYAGQGVSAGEVGLHFALAGLPWAAQPILWGPLVDRAGASAMGRRRVWSVSALIGSQLALCGLLLLPSERALGLVGAIFFLNSLSASLLDTACDRMVMDHTPTPELGRMSACTRSGFVIGTSLSAALFGWALPALGFSMSVGVLLGLTSAVAAFAMLVREAPGDALVSFARRPSDGPEPRGIPFPRFLKRLALGLRRPAALRLLAVCFSVDFALASFEVRLGVDIVQSQGWDAAALSRLQAGLALASGTLGALAIGIWSDRAGPILALRALFAASAAAFAVASLIIANGMTGAAAPAILALTTVLPNLLIVALAPALMRTSRRRAGAATRFEAFMAVMNLGSVAGAAAAGLGAQAAPLAGAALLAAFVLVACAALTWRPDFLPE